MRSLRDQVQAGIPAALAPVARLVEGAVRFGVLLLTLGDVKSGDGDDLDPRRYSAKLSGALRSFLVAFGFGAFAWAQSPGALHVVTWSACLAFFVAGASLAVGAYRARRAYIAAITRIAAAEDESEAREAPDPER